MYPIESAMIAITMIVGINSLLSFSRMRLTIIPMMVPAKAQKTHPIIEENPSTDIPEYIHRSARKY